MPTHIGKNSNPILSPDGRWLVFVKQSKIIMPERCTDFSNIDSKYANELWVYDLKNMKKRILVKDNFACDDPEKRSLIQNNYISHLTVKRYIFKHPHGLLLVLFMQSIWIQKNSRFVTDGNEYHVIKEGRYKGDLAINQHRYRFKGDTPLGSYDWDWLYTPQGKQIKLYKKKIENLM